MHRDNKPISILIVDDDRQVRETLAQVFHAKGFAVSEADNAAHALALVLEHPFDAVLTDIRMPKDSGLALLSKIKKYRPEIHVFIMTGSPDTVEKEITERLAAAVFLKPFRPQTLIDAVRAACGARRGLALAS